MRLREVSVPVAQVDFPVGHLVALAGVVLEPHDPALVAHQERGPARLPLFLVEEHRSVLQVPPHRNPERLGRHAKALLRERDLEGLADDLGLLGLNRNGEASHPFVADAGGARHVVDRLARPQPLLHLADAQLRLGTRNARLGLAAAFLEQTRDRFLEVGVDVN